MEISVYELYILSNDMKTYMLHLGWNINIYSKCVENVTRDGASLKWLCYIFSPRSKTHLIHFRAFCTCIDYTSLIDIIYTLSHVKWFIMVYVKKMLMFSIILKIACLFYSRIRNALSYLIKKLTYAMSVQMWYFELWLMYT